jgi:hypothetical protein
MVTFISRSTRAAEAATLWKQQYYNNMNGWYKLFLNRKDTNSEDIYNKLVALIDPTPDEVDKAIGPGGWTRCTCDNCNNDVEELLQIGAAPDYESATTRICFKCLKEIHKNYSVYLPSK